MSTQATMTERLGDRLNPILVKEVRQALRGKYFRVLFWITLLVGTLIGLGVIAEAGSEPSIETGRVFFMTIFGVLSAAVHCFVPFSAFLSTSAEWDENTYDLLIISNLRPRQIVQGKLLSALIQALLYYSTFGPFLVFAFLLNGIDLGSVAVILAGSFALCIALTLSGVAASSLASNKILRVVIMALFGLGLMAVWGMSLGLAAAITFEPQVLRSIEGQVAFVVFLTAALVLALLANAVALARFAHEEENRSTPLRVIATVIVVFATLWGTWLVAEFGAGEAMMGCQAAAVLLSFLPWLLLSTEPEELPRRTSASAPRSRVLALLQAAYIPGGGRGALLCFLLGALAVSGSLLGMRFASGSLPIALDVTVAVAAMYAYLLVFSTLAGGIGAYFVRRASARLVLRIAVVVAVPVLIIVPSLMAIFLDSNDGSDAFSHGFNPFYVVYALGQGERPTLALVGLALAVALSLVVNAPRVYSGLCEILAASRTVRTKGTDAPAA